MPEEWLDNIGSDLEIDTVEEVIAALTDEAHPVQERVRNTSPNVAAEFEKAFSSATRTSRGYAEVLYNPSLPVAWAASSLALWLGFGRDTYSSAIGGHISIVSSGIGHRHDQAWHTDSTPWVVPNRWTILGLLSMRERLALPATGILPLETVASALAWDPAVLQRLRSHSVDWRANFPDLSPLRAPILDATFPRWVHPVVVEQHEEMGGEFQGAVESLVSVLSHGALWHEPTVKPGVLLVFDNYAVLHRAPLLEATAGRQLLRIKVGGVPVY